MKQNKQTSVKLTKLITNQYIIGKTTEENMGITIYEPYMLIPDPNGIQIFPYDEAIIGVKLEEITIGIDTTIYSTKVNQELQNTYLQAISGIEVEPKKEILLG
jgi:hypothetical protein